MPITFACLCGKKLRAKDSGAGRSFDCPGCGASIEVPVPDAVDLGIQTNDGPDEPSPAVVIPPVATSPLIVSERLSRSDYLASRKRAASIPSSPRRDAVAVTVVDFDMPFGSLVWMLFKFEFAAFVALILVGATLLIPLLILAAIFKGGIP